MSDLPEYFFRVRENGAAVFRVDGENRDRRLDMDQIAVANTRNGEIKPQGGRALSERDQTAIRDWMTARRTLESERAFDDILRTVDRLNLTAQWAQAKASDEDLDAVTDALLMAMHDLRTTLVRRKGDRLLAARRD